jgi:hypothetical protein
MAKKTKKSQKPASKFEAVVEWKYGKGKKTQSVTLPVTLDFTKIFSVAWRDDSETLQDEAFWRASDIEFHEKVLNLKELKQAFKAWLAATSED